MLTWMREKFGTVIIGAIIGFIAFVFIFFGVFNPRTTSGLHEGSVAGKVNGDSISIAEFNRELNRRMEFFKSLGGGTMNEAQIKAFRIKDGVFNELVNRKLVSQAAAKSGMIPSDEEIKTRIREMPVFQKENRFDPLTYRQILAANNYSPAGFEKLMREDLAVQQWTEYFRRRVLVSEEELKREFLATAEKRNIKYVLITPEAARKGLNVPAAEIDAYLKDPAKLNLAKNQFEAGKETEFKGKKFEDVQHGIARDLVAATKSEESRKASEKLAQDVAAQLSAGGSDASAQALLKPYGLQVQKTGLIARQGSTVAGIGEVKELAQDAFAKKSPIDASAGGKPKVYQTAAGTVVALVIESQAADLAKLDAERTKLRNDLIARKERELQEAWMKKLQAQAKIERNEAVVGDESGA